MEVDYDIESREYIITMLDDEAMHIHSALGHALDARKIDIKSLDTIFTLRKLIENINIRK